MSVPSNAHVLEAPDAHGPWTLPTTDRSPLDAALASAHQRSRQDSLLLFQSLLPGLPLAELAQRADGGTLLVGQGAGNLAPIGDTAEILERLLARHDLGHAKLKLVKGGRDPVDGAMVRDQIRSYLPTVRGSLGRLALALMAGHTVVLDGIDQKHPTLQRLTEHFERVYACQININGYLSLMPDESFGAHWDSHEVVIIQLLGHKRWEVHEPETLSPHRLIHDQNTTTRKPVWSGIIGPGDYLQIPRGWGHNVTGIEELTFHLTVTIPRPSVFEVVNQALEEASNKAAQVANLRGDLTDLLIDLRDHVRGAVTPEAIEGALARGRGNIHGRHTQSTRVLAQTLAAGTIDPDVLVRSPIPGGITLGPEEGGRRHVNFAGTRASFDADSLTLLAPYLDGRAWKVGSLGLPESLIAQALSIGLLELVALPTAWGVIPGSV